MLNSEALTKIQSSVLIAIIVVAALGAAYVLWGGEEEQSGEPIRVGVCADLDQIGGEAIWQAAVLATEQVNAEGGVLGRNFTIVAQDDDTASNVAQAFSNAALEKLITVDKANLILTEGGLSAAAFEEIAAEHKKVLFMLTSADEVTQRVLDNYDRYKYVFRPEIPNSTMKLVSRLESLVICREYTGFNKIAVLFHDVLQRSYSAISDTLEEYGFEVVLTQSIQVGVMDFSSYFAKAEAAGAEILYPHILVDLGIPFAKEYYDRQSPMVMWGKLYGRSDYWELTEGKCECISSIHNPIVGGYPWTSKTVSTQEAYFERWGEAISGQAAAAYDTVRFILPDAIERAGTIETEAVIKALEETEVETSLVRRFVFTSSHDTMIGEAGSNRPIEDYYVDCVFQWQEGEQVPVYPEEIMEEAGATYIYPDWDGPWNK